MSLLTYLAVLLFSVSLNYGYELPEEKFVETIYFPESQTTVRLKVNNTVAAKTSFHDFSLTQVSLRCSRWACSLVIQESSLECRSPME